MQVGEREFTSTQPLKHLPDRDSTPQADARSGSQQTLHVPIRVPGSLWGAFALMARFDMAVALTVPALFGAALGWWETGSFNSVTFLLTLLAVLCVSLGANLLHEYCDYLRGNSHDSPASIEPFVTGYGMMMAGSIEPLVVRGLGQILLAIGIVASLWLALMVGWPALCFAGFALLLALLYAIPPVQYGYRGWGLGTVGVFLCYGLIEITGSYYIQSHTLTWLPIWASVPLGLSVAVVFLKLNIVHYRRDWALRNRTLAVTLGLERALDAGALLTVLCFAAILFIVSLTRLPLWALLGLAALPMALGPYAQVRRDNVTHEQSFNLYGAAVSAAILTGLLLTLGLWADAIL